MSRIKLTEKREEGSLTLRHLESGFCSVRAEVVTLYGLESFTSCFFSPLSCVVKLLSALIGHFSPAFHAQPVDSALFSMHE